MLAYLSRYTHRIAIANSRLVAFDGERVTFKWKDYWAKGEARYKFISGQPLRQQKSDWQRYEGVYLGLGDCSHRRPHRYGPK